MIWRNRIGENRDKTINRSNEIVKAITLKGDWNGQGWWKYRCEKERQREKELTQYDVMLLQLLGELSCYLVMILEISINQNY